jgi:AcrR family transcriptional regulator
MESNGKTSDRILATAFRVFLEQGIRRSSLTDVALRASVTRITVYRYFGDKKRLVRDVCLGVAGIFKRTAEQGQAASAQQMNERLNRLGEELSRLPKGNLLAMLDEVNALYRDVYDEFSSLRQASLDAIFEQTINAAMQDGTLRPGLNLDVLKTIFWSSIMGLIENPTLISSSVSLSEIFTTVTEVFRYGILRARPETSPLPPGEG